MITNKKASAPPAGKKPAPKKPLAGINAKAEQGLGKVSHRNNFYKHGTKRIYIAAIVAIAGLGLQALVAASVFTAKSERVYFATDSNGSLIQLIPLGQPNQKDIVVAQWAQRALVETFSFNFTDYKHRLNNATMTYFTKEGGDALLNALDSVGVIDAISDRKLILSMTLDHTPVLMKSGPLRNGVYSWTFQASAIMTYRTQSQEHTNPVKFMIQVDRRSVMENADGLGISRIIMQRR